MCHRRGEAFLACPAAPETTASEVRSRALRRRSVEERTSGSPPLSARLRGRDPRRVPRHPTLHRSAPWHIAAGGDTSRGVAAPAHLWRRGHVPIVRHPRRGRRGPRRAADGGRARRGGHLPDALGVSSPRGRSASASRRGSAAGHSEITPRSHRDRHRGRHRDRHSGWSTRAGVRRRWDRQPARCGAVGTPRAADLEPDLRPLA
jgi:hypothetical protein